MSLLSERDTNNSIYFNKLPKRIGLSLPLMYCMWFHSYCLRHTFFVSHFILGKKNLLFFYTQIKFDMFDIEREQEHLFEFHILIRRSYLSLKWNIRPKNETDSWAKSYNFNLMKSILWFRMRMFQFSWINCIAETYNRGNCLFSVWRNWLQCVWFLFTFGWNEDSIA